MDLIFSILVLIALAVFIVYGVGRFINRTKLSFVATLVDGLGFLAICTTGSLCGLFLLFIVLFSFETIGHYVEVYNASL